MKKPLDHSSRSHVDNSKRRSLKLMSGAGAILLPSILPAATSANLRNVGDLADKGTGQILPDDQAHRHPTANGHGQIGISIMSCKSMVHDWILIENLSQRAIQIEHFQLQSSQPAVVAYQGKLLHLNKLLDTAYVSQQRLHIATDYAWSESLQDIAENSNSSSLKATLDVNHGISAISADTQVTKCWAEVSDHVATVFADDPALKFT